MSVLRPFRSRYVRERKIFPVTGPIWEHVDFFRSGKDYFEACLAACQKATHSIRIETYIFEIDEHGEAILSALREAASRGVKVRLLVDAIGSPQFTAEKVRELSAQGVRVRVFGRPRELIREAAGKILRVKLWTAFQILRKFQLRDHRKLAVFDESRAFVGSANIGSRFSNWRETTVALRGPGVVRLKQSFVRSWRLAAREKLHDELFVYTAAIRTNFTRGERRGSHLYLIEHLRKEPRRVYLTTAYFHPRPRLLVALFAALHRGIDVRILSPKRSDIAWFPWISRAMYSGLMKLGAKIYEYEPGMIHAKTTLLGNTVFVGSTNMNYRSFLHDLELDVVISEPSAIEVAEELFRQDLSESTELTKDSIRGYTPFALVISVLVWPVKRWL